MKVMQFDDIFTDYIGDYGRYQIFQLILLYFSTLPVAASSLIAVLISPIVQYRCAIPGLKNDTFHIQDSAHACLINRTIVPGKGSFFRYDRCNVYSVDLDYEGCDPPVEANITKCSSWVFDKSTFQTTMNEDFELVCENSVFVSTYQVVGTVGALLGAQLVGVFADRFGRKKAIICSIVIRILAGVGEGLSQNIYLLFVLKAIAGIAIYGVFLSGFVMSMELSGPSRRTLVGMIYETSYVFGVCLLPFFGYFIREWRTLQIVLSSIIGVLLFIYPCLLEESPRWLFVRKRKDECERILKKMARVNHVTLPDNILDKVAIEQTQYVSILMVLKSKKLSVWTVVLFVNWVVNNMTYYGITLNVGSLAGDLYMNLFLLTVVELISCAIPVCLLDTLGRKPPYVVCMVLGGLTCIGVILLRLYGGEYAWLTTVLAILGKLFISTTFVIMINWACEIYPTEVRNSCLGASTMAGALGGVAAPYIAQMTLLIDSELAVVVPYIVFAVLAFIGASTSMLLPETRGKPMPQTVAEANLLGDLFCKGDNTYSMSGDKEHAAYENPALELNHYIPQSL